MGKAYSPYLDYVSFIELVPPGESNTAPTDYEKNRVNLPQ